jgi:phosphoribosylformylglycinamidine synthase
MEESYREFARRIKDYQIIGFPNGSLLGDEPETGGKLMKLILSNSYIKEEINNHLVKRDGLILGIGAGFLGLMKLGLIEKGIITDRDKDGINIAYNKGGQFISSMVNVRVSSNLSPWFNEMTVGDIFTAPIATKEGRIIGDLEKIKPQISTQFADENLTGSLFNVESMSSPDGRVLGTICSIDRIGDGLYKNSENLGTHKIFESGINYFR